ncbi:MAG: hypothetical protein JWL95_1929 [Gemmatimonadetes bacterium]|nr:hypothetical protein [Gemmatimonadota bacterium]
MHRYPQRIRRLSIGCPLILACAGDDARNHVHQSPPPMRAVQPAAAPAPDVPEPPVGGGWASAKISSVRLASTGAPAALGEITDPVQVLVVVTRGRGSSPDGPARLELHLSGATDTTLVEPIASPVPLVIAHEFLVVPGHGPTGLGDGPYRLGVRLVRAAGTTIAQSTPLWLTIRAR